MKKLIYHLDQQEAKMKSLLYIMDRYQISLEGYHELTHCMANYLDRMLLKSCKGMFLYA